MPPAAAAAAVLAVWGDVDTIGMGWGGSLRRAMYKMDDLADQRHTSRHAKNYLGWEGPQGRYDDKAQGAQGKMPSVRRPLRLFWRPFWLRFTYATPVLVKKYWDATDAARWSTRASDGRRKMAVRTLCPLRRSAARAKLVCFGSRYWRWCVSRAPQQISDKNKVFAIKGRTTGPPIGLSHQQTGRDTPAYSFSGSVRFED
jgi:hypothetical protein